MENKLIITNNKETITSLELVKQINIFRQQEGNRAELQHYDLLKIIRDEFEEEIGLGKISVSSYKNSQNKEQPMFILTYNQAKQILVRESKFVRKAVIEYIEKLEQQLQNQHKIPASYPEALRLYADEVEKNEKLALENKVQEQQILELQPKALYYDLILQCKELLSATTIAKDYGLSARAFNLLLHELGVQYNQSGIWFLYQKYASYGYTQTKTNPFTRPDGTLDGKPHMYWTQKGRLFIYNLLKEKNILPLIEKDGEVA